MPPTDPAFDLNSPHATAAHAALRAIQRGRPLADDAPDSCGPWWPALQALQQAYAEGGHARFTELFLRLSDRFHPLRDLVFAPHFQGTPPPSSAAPPLPGPVAAFRANAAPCAAWLDAYIDFATHAAPMTPRSFHEAAGLFLAALAVGRRLVYLHGLIPFYPNLYILWIGPTTLYRKSTGVAIFTNVLRRAGLQHLLLADNVSAEALLQELSLAIPDIYQHWDQPRRDRWLAQRALAAQRGVLMDEASFLFDSFGQEGKGALLSLLLRLYDCPDELSEHTIARGLTVVERAALSFFGITTPAGMAPHFRSATLWGKGLWRRFALIVPDAERIWHTNTGAVAYPAAVIDGLTRLHDLFPRPTARLVQPRSPRRYVAIDNLTEPSVALLAQGVAEAWSLYAKATGHDMLVGGGVDELLYGCYGGLGAHALKIAMLLAAMDAEHLPVRVELPHLVRALNIVESWRESLHRVWAGAVVTTENHVDARILKALAAKPASGLTVRDLCQQLHLPSAEIKRSLAVLAQAGQVRRWTYKAANGKQIELWQTNRALANNLLAQHLHR